MSCPEKTYASPARVVPEDKHTIARIATLHPKLRASARAVYDECRALGIRLRFTSTFRSLAEQQAIYNQGRTTKGPVVSNARPGTSWHNYGCAFDIALLSEDSKSLVWDMRYDSPDEGKEADWLQVAAIAKRHSWSWGGDWGGFKDNPHFEYTFRLTIAQALARVKAGKVDAAGYLLI